MMQCNINQSGRVARLLVGFVMFFVGSVLFVVAVPGDTVAWRLFQIAVMLLGSFIMFEGIMGWCAIKAMASKLKR